MHAGARQSAELGLVLFYVAWDKLSDLQYGSAIIYTVYLNMLTGESGSVHVHVARRNTNGNNIIMSGFLRCLMQL